MGDTIKQVMLLDEGIDPNKLGKEDLERLLKNELYESYISGNKYFWHRGQEYMIGKDISLEVAQVICLAQWVNHEDRLWFAHALFESCLNVKMYPNLGAYIAEVVKEIAEEIEGEGNSKED